MATHSLLSKGISDDARKQRLSTVNCTAPIMVIEIIPQTKYAMLNATIIIWICYKNVAADRPETSK